MPGYLLKSTQFRKEREKNWRRLEDLLDRVQAKGVQSLSAAELASLPALYRGVISSLSVARAISLDRNVIDYLEALAARAYFTVYGTKRSIFAVLTEFFGRRFPGEVRRHAGSMVLAGAFMALGSLCAFFMVLDDPEYYYSFVPEAMAQGRNPDASTESLRAVLFSGDEHSGEGLAAFASRLFNNNSGVGMLCFAIGFIPGCFVFLVLFYNGLIIGAFAGLYHQRGLSLELWSWLLPHGVTELLAIVLCGGAGLVLGRSLLFPGRRTRLQALAESGRGAAVVVIGCIALFFIAALIEGFFRQMVQDMTVRYAVATGTAFFWVVYFGFVGRPRSVV